MLELVFLAALAWMALVCVDHLTMFMCTSVSDFQAWLRGILCRPPMAQDSPSVLRPQTRQNSRSRTARRRLLSSAIAETLPVSPEYVDLEYSSGSPSSTTSDEEDGGNSCEPLIRSENSQPKEL